ncbi:zinc finger MYM-type protein 1-like [Photinus pyralis]|uniref:zinc finger MYM-type protein 1-like n=1 Tax=Photinus pyralis TaxID=7054 RepID=UPI0012672DC0|nr:zinc finger MYM-type protein 1-like [Photinus pyralis]
MKRSYESGSAKRKKQKERIVEQEALRNSMASFLSNSSAMTRNLDPPSSTSICIPVPQRQRQSTSECGNRNTKDEDDDDIIANTLHQETSNSRHHEDTGDTDTGIIVNDLKLDDTSLQLGDIAKWPTDISEKLIGEILDSVPKNFGKIENLKSSYVDKEKVYTRTFQESNFYTIKSNGIKEKREWLIFSDTSKSVYCFVCKLFSRSRVSSKMIVGCNDWKNICRILTDHERSQEHVKSMCCYNKRRLSSGRIDAELCKQLKSEENYWREVLKRVVATVKLLGSLGLAFRGTNDTVGSQNKGNFLTCLEYLSQFDNFLKSHLEKYGNCGKGSVNYLSHSICDEFINLMAKKTLDVILDDIRNAMYFSLSVDSTPDISHVDQLVLIIRYLNQHGEIKERFLGIIPIEAHNAEHLENVILGAFKEFSLDITKFPN